MTISDHNKIIIKDKKINQLNLKLADLNLIKKVPQKDDFLKIILNEIPEKNLINQIIEKEFLDFPTKYEKEIKLSDSLTKSLRERLDRERSLNKIRFVASLATLGLGKEKATELGFLFTSGIGDPQELLETYKAVKNDKDLEEAFLFFCSKETPRTYKTENERYSAISTEHGGFTSLPTDFLESISTIVDDLFGFSGNNKLLPELFKKVLLAEPNLGKNLLIAAYKNLKSNPQAAKKTLLDIYLHILEVKYLKSTNPKEKNTLIDLIGRTSVADNVPYKLSSPEARKCFEEVLSVRSRGFAIHHGFSPLMYEFRRNPEKMAPLLARFGADIGNGAHYINSLDPNSMPGRGFQISGINREKTFIKDDSTLDPYQVYKEAWQYLAKDFDSIEDTKFTFLRGAIAVSAPEDKSHLIQVDENGRKVHYSYVIFNDHFSGKDSKHAGTERVYLVPTEVLNRKLEGTLINYNDFTGYNKNIKDVNDSDFTLEGLQKEAAKINAPVLDLGSGTVFSGGLCNAFPAGKKWFYPNELELGKRGHTKDVWGVVHKSHVSGRYDSEMNPTTNRLLIPFREAHDEVYSVSNSLQNRLELAFEALSLWHKGYTATSSSGDINVDEFFSSVDKADELRGTEKEPWMGDDPSLANPDGWWRGEEISSDKLPNGDLLEPTASDIDDADWWKGEVGKAEVSEGDEWKVGTEYDENHMESPTEISASENEPKSQINPHVFRLLTEAYIWHNGGKDQGITDRDFYPVLSFGPKSNLWNIEKPTTHLDTFDMSIVTEGRRIKLPEHSTGVGDEISEGLWNQFFVRFFSEDNDIRPYHRKDLGIE